MRASDDLCAADAVGPAAAVARADDGHDRDPARFARRMYGLPWMSPATLPVRVNVFALTRAMNLLMPAPPIVRRARDRAAA